jgi:hypothetical protein
MSSHEPIRSHKHIVGPTNRSFGLVFSAFFILFAVWPLIWRGESPRLWAGGVAAIFLILALFASEALAPLNKLWLKLGLTLQLIFSPIIMALLFYTAVTPTAFVMRLFGHDPLKLRYDADLPSYWIERKPSGPKRDSFKKQY